MADTKISALVAASVAADANELVINEAGTSKKLTAAQLKSYVQADRYFIRADVNRTLASNTNVQAIFSSPANGRLTLTTGVYIFESVLIVTAMSATSGNALIDVKGAGTSTIGSWVWFLHGLDNTAPATIADDDSAFFQTSGTAASAVAAATGTAMRLRFKGSFECTAAGTLIPSIDLVTAASAVVQEGSWFECEKIGANGLVSVGPWD